MWRMQDGDRVLTDAEWALFEVALHLLREFIEDDIDAQTDHTSTGVPVFDRLTPEQKLALLADTAHALRDPSVPTPRHTAANEGAIAAVFSILREELAAELDLACGEDEAAGRTDVRRLLRAVCEGDDREEPLPDATDTDAEEWDGLLEEFEVRIFWDDDYTMGDEFLDLPPAFAQEQLQFAGIDPDYYLAVPDEPTEAGLIAARQTLARLLGLPVPDDDGLYPTLDDLYHCLIVGPCSPEQSAAWEDHPWVRFIQMTEPGWDCDYPTWQAGFSQAVPPTPFEVAPAGEGDHELPEGLRLERWGDGWVVRNEDGSYWCDLVDNAWADAPNEEELPALSFPSEREAKVAFAQADRMYGERAKRRKQALAALGLDDD